MEIVIKEKPSLYQPVFEEFLAYPPYSEEAFPSAKKAVLEKTYPREQLVQILTEYNTTIGGDEKVFTNISRLKEKESVCIVTGQQLGFMGGPGFTILKGLSCLLLAKKTNAVPIFWLATEDHDLEEVDHTFLIDAMGNLKEFKVPIGSNKERHALEDIELTQKLKEVMQKFLEAVNWHVNLPAVNSYPLTMAAFMAHLFKGTGLIFLEPKILKPLGQTFFQREIKEAEAILIALQTTKQRLLEQGGEAPLAVEEGPQLFLKSELGRRERLILEGSVFRAGEKSYSYEELLNKSPERFSTNAASRPIFQSSVLPVAAYVAGPAELKYWKQLKGYFVYHNVPMPWVVPRLSATFITPQGGEMLNKLSLKPWEAIPMHWGELFSDVEENLTALQSEWKEKALKLFPKELSHKHFETFLRHQMSKLEKTLLTKKLKSKGVPTFALHYLRNLIHPHNHLQERVLNFCGFNASAKSSLVIELLRRLEWNTKGHAYVFC